MAGEPTEEEKKKHTRVKVSIGEYQVELEGTYENVQSLMKKPVYKFIEGLQAVVGEIPAPAAEVKPPAATEYPPPLGRPATLGEALRVLMVESGWGRKPRTLGDIMTALETSGLYHKKAAVATTLVHLMKSGVLRRLGSRGSYKYVAA